MHEKSFLAGLPTDTALDATDARTFVVRFMLDEPWRGNDARTRLDAAYFRDASGALRAFVTDASIEAPLPTNAAEFAALAARHRAALLDFAKPLRLGTVDVPKPWGKEIWFTGYERRGVCDVCDARGRTPLPWALACAPRRLCAEHPVLLLKILSSSPVPVTGALYLELHREKREVYVVADVDRSAWPSGIAAVRYGMNQRTRQAFDDDAAFRVAFVAAVKRYEAVRREVDSNGRTMTAELVRREADTRAAVDEFTTLLPLAIGDALCVPTLVPHSLQHGVRVIEIQTPTYERQIIAAGHKVLTQSHWDTEAAASAMRLDVPDRSPIRSDVPAAGVVRERIATVDDFTVTRCRLDSGASHRFTREGPYAIAIALQGEVSIDTTVLGPENACMLPGTMKHATLHNRSTGNATLLIAEPIV